MPSFSPHLIIILLLSLCTLLVVLLFMIRARKKKNASSPETKTEKNAPPAAAEQGVLSSSQEALDMLDQLSELDLSDLGPSVTEKRELSLAERGIIELVNRYRFFQGENLKRFEDLLRKGDTSGIQRLIREKLQAQGKPDAEALSLQVTQKLLGAL